MKTIFISALCMMNLICLAQGRVSLIDDRPHTKANGSTVAFGIKAGANVANLKDEHDASTNSLVGFQAGLLAHIHLSSELAIQPEINYSSQGAKYPNLGDEKLNYIAVPVLLQYMFSGGFRIETGPQVGILASAKLKRYSGGEPDIKNQCKDADLSWAFGLGYLMNSGLGIDARYNLGLTNIVNTASYDVKNRVWQFGLFYQFMRNSR